MRISPEAAETPEMDPATLGITLADFQGQFVEATFDIEMTSPDGVRSRKPVDRSLFSMGNGQRLPSNDLVLIGPEVADLQATLMVREGKAVLRNMNADLAMLMQSKPFKFGEWKLGEVVEVAGHRLVLAAHEAGVATLELYTDPWRGRKLTLYPGTNLVGRSGKRFNQVQLDDVTVSRAQARFDWEGECFWLSAEQQVSPTCVNGRSITERTPLQNGDLLQFGKQIARFRYEREGRSDPSMSSQRCTLLYADLGNYSALLGGTVDEDLIRQISRFFEVASTHIEHFGGQLASYAGEAVMGFFGLENFDAKSARRGLSAARAIQAELAQCNLEWKAAGLPPLEATVGLYSGPLQVGCVRLPQGTDWSAAGRGVEVAASLQRLAHQQGTFLACCGNTAELLGPAGLQPVESPIQGEELRAFIYQND